MQSAPFVIGCTGLNNRKGKECISWFNSIRFTVYRIMSSTRLSNPADQYLHFKAFPSFQSSCFLLLIECSYPWLELFMVIWSSVNPVFTFHQDRRTDYPSP